MAKMTATERLVKLQAKQADLVGAIYKIKTSARKLQTRRKIQLGGLVIKAGLGELDDATLLGLLLTSRVAFDDRPGIAAELHKAGDVALHKAAAAERARTTDRVLVTFPATPPDSVRAALKGKHFTYYEQEGSWIGAATKEEILAIPGLPADTIVAPEIVE
jgi:hypothetical protein